MNKMLLLVVGLIWCAMLQAECLGNRVKLQVLGSGGPELDDQRASTGYLLWLDGKATVMIDAGPGVALHFEQSGAKINDLKFVLFSHLHVDHSADFVAFLKGFYFSGRQSNLPVYGPEGNGLMPGMVEYVEMLAGRRGIYRYLSEYVDEQRISSFKIRPHDISVTDKRLIRVYHGDDLTLSAVPVHHGPLPALAWRVDSAGCSITFSGDLSNRFGFLSRLAANSDLLIVHNAIPEQAKGVARKLHLPPSEIGKIAAQANVKKLILSHRMQRTLGIEGQTLAYIRRLYPGPVVFAEDMDIFVP